MGKNTQKKVSIASKDLNFDFWDLDGTLANTKEKDGFDLALAEVIQENVKTLRRSAKAGRSIFIFTSRHWMDYKDIKAWLNKHKIPFKAIICGKPMGRTYIDDKAINPNCKECMNKWKE
jgi:hypothetical protein